MQNQPVTEELLQEITEKIVREVNPRKVVLFGSHARGTARPDSDLDFLIIEDGPFNAQQAVEKSLKAGRLSPRLCWVQRRRSAYRQTEDKALFNPAA